MDKEVRGKVIRILDKRTVIINLGSSDNIKLSNIFTIYGNPESIKDPETGEELGKISVAKSRLKAKKVYDKFTIASTRWLKPVPSELNRKSLINFEKYFGYQYEEHDEGEMNVEQEDIEPWKAESEEPVKVGDIVVTTVDAFVPKEESNQSESDSDSKDG